jgi:hypothetical protein
MLCAVMFAHYGSVVRCQRVADYPSFVNYPANTIGYANNRQCKDDRDAIVILVVHDSFQQSRISRPDETTALSQSI